jgi:hypothetical protein
VRILKSCEDSQILHTYKDEMDRKIGKYGNSLEFVLKTQCFCNVVSTTPND